MRELADDVWRLDEFPPVPLINVYLAGDVLIDAGRSWDKGRILKQTADRELSLLALTHVHPDHQGSAHAVCEERGIPLACHAGDVDAMEGRRQVRASDAALAKLYARLWEGPSHKVGRVLQDGDTIGDFTVVHAPGHAPGEEIFWRESDRVAATEARRDVGGPHTGCTGGSPLDPQARRPATRADLARPRPASPGTRFDRAARGPAHDLVGP